MTLEEVGEPAHEDPRGDHLGVHTEPSPLQGWVQREQLLLCLVRHPSEVPLKMLNIFG